MSCLHETKEWNFRKLNPEQKRQRWKKSCSAPIPRRGPNYCLFPTTQNCGTARFLFFSNLISSSSFRFSESKLHLRSALTSQPPTSTPPPLTTPTPSAQLFTEPHPSTQTGGLFCRRSLLVCLYPSPPHPLDCKRFEGRDVSNTFWGLWSLA